MKIFLKYILFFIPLITIGQTNGTVEIKVNPELSIFADLNEDSIPNGRYLVRYQNKTIMQGKAKNGKMDGEWTSYYNNNQKKIEGRYIDGDPHGEWIRYSKTGKVLAKFQYNRGRKIGHWQGYFTQSYIKGIDIVYNPDGSPAQSIQYFPSGIIALNHEYTKQGSSTKIDRAYYYENFKLFEYSPVVNNELVGEYQLFHDNGVNWATIQYEKNQPVNVLEMHSKGGMPRKNNEFRDGNGVLIEYYSNGNTFRRTSYKNGMKHGKVEIFDLGGSLSGEGQFNQGEAVGNWDIYSKFHNRVFTVYFDSIPGLQFVTRRISPADKEREEGTIKDGFRHGEWKMYNPYGEIVSETNYKYGFLDGKQTYYEGAKVSKVFHYSNGNKCGNFTYYNAFGKTLSEDVFKCESEMDSNWFVSPEPGWITVSNLKNQNNKVRYYFYPPFPGTELADKTISLTDQKEELFLIDRTFGYDYTPELLPPSFIGGRAKEKEYFRRNLAIPKSLLSEKVSGEVVLRYQVDEIGMISKIEVVKSMGMGLDEAAVDLIKSLPPHNPASLNGIPVPCYIVREIDFRIN